MKVRVVVQNDGLVQARNHYTDSYNRLNIKIMKALRHQQKDQQSDNTK